MTDKTQLEAIKEIVQLYAMTKVALRVYSHNKPTIFVLDKGVLNTVVLSTRDEETGNLNVYKIQPAVAEEITDELFALYAEDAKALLIQHHQHELKSRLFAQYIDPPEEVPQK
jgi:hypothetical protein|tara:strand:- start:19366 stop:19704 length:339 start_codon:yes stop_codon:yes gene_type:complete